MPLLRGIGYLATCRVEGGQEAIHGIRDAALVWEGDRIVWAGPEAELPPAHRAAESVHDAGGRLVVPGLVDAHTHLAFGGWRAREFVARIGGKSYREIAAAGGGIASTVRHTREASEEALLERSRRFAREMLALGITTVEAKSGYCLEPEGELKLLRVYRRLAALEPLCVVPTFLGAHTVPAEFANDRAGYLDVIVEDMLPRVAGEGLAEFCDVFMEEGTAFDAAESRRVLRAARDHGLGIKVHADQLSDGGGARLAAELGAASADHLEHVSAAGIEALAASGTVAVILPLATLYLGQAPPPVRSLIDGGVAVAVATDFNPGTAPSLHLPLAMLLACTVGGMTPSEALKGATLYAARALGREDHIGSIEAGKSADFAVIDAPDPDHWMYHFRSNACVRTFARGTPRWEARG